MSARKIQVWFRPDQADLVVTMLKVCHATINVRPPLIHSSAEEAARQFIQRRINEVLALFPAENTCRFA